MISDVLHPISMNLATRDERSVLRNAADSPTILAAFRAGWHSRSGLYTASDEIAASLQARLDHSGRVEREMLCQARADGQHMWAIRSGYRQCQACNLYT